jgi:hypothetical protein
MTFDSDAVGLRTLLEAYAPPSMSQGLRSGVNDDVAAIEPKAVAVVDDGRLAGAGTAAHQVSTRAHSALSLHQPAHTLHVVLHAESMMTS